MKIITILGARPQFIKASTLSRAFINNDIKEIIVHTGQHYDANMSDIFFEEMHIPKPDYQLQITSKYHGEMTGRMLLEIEKILIKEKPDTVLVYGDTNTTLAGALAAAKLHIPIAHVESGLRSFNRRMPEEINRVITDQISSQLFAPTTTAVDNLVHEGIDGSKVHLVGDVMYDAVLFYRELSSRKSTIIDKLGIKNKPFLLATIHREENTNNPARLNTIFEQLDVLSKNKLIVLPLHPRTRTYLKKDFQNPNFKIINPVSYFDMVSLQENCRLVMTDSGGVQKEAYFNNKYCITAREETEWVELVENNFNFLAKPLEKIAALVETLWDKEFIDNSRQLYGDGRASEKIASILKS